MLRTDYSGKGWKQEGVTGLLPLVTSTRMEAVEVVRIGDRRVNRIHICNVLSSATLRADSQLGMPFAEITALTSSSMNIRPLFSYLCIPIHTKHGALQIC